MDRTLLSWIKIYGARAICLATGRVPSAATWPLVWRGSRRFALDRWLDRDAGFERRRFSYDDALAFVTETRRGAPKDMAEGSIPEADLEFIAGYLPGLKSGGPLRGLHIGNFVGLSLAYLTEAMRRTDPESLMLSVDPNIPHRGVDVPQDLVTGLMTRYGLETNWLPVTGFTLDRSSVHDILNDKRSATAYSSYHGFSSAQVLNNLTKLGVRFDFALIDGNHNASYLRREISLLRRLIRPGGYLFLDDVNEDWEGVTAVFEGLDSGKFRKIAHENRVGVVQLVPARKDGGKKDGKGGKGGKRPGRKPGGAGARGGRRKNGMAGPVAGGQ